MSKPSTKQSAPSIGVGLAQFLLFLLLAVIITPLSATPLSTTHVPIDTFQAKLIAQSDVDEDDLQIGAQFGNSVSIDGDTALIGAPTWSPNVTIRPGSAYVYPHQLHKIPPEIA